MEVRNLLLRFDAAGLELLSRLRTARGRREDAVRCSATGDGLPIVDLRVSGIRLTEARTESNAAELFLDLETPGRVRELVGIHNMCLAVPGKVLDEQWIGESRVGTIQFGGVTRQAYLDFVPEASVGDFVIVHVGFAISKVDEEEAHRTYELLEKLGQLQEDGLSS